MLGETVGTITIDAGRILNAMGRGGIEPPTHGFSVRCSNSAGVDGTRTYENSAEALTPQLTPEIPKQGEIDTSKLSSELAEIVAVWPKLPEHIKRAIRALVRTSAG